MQAQLSSGLETFKQKPSSYILYVSREGSGETAPMQESWLLADMINTKISHSGSYYQGEGVVCRYLLTFFSPKYSVKNNKFKTVSSNNIQWEKGLNKKMLRNKKLGEKMIPVILKWKVDQPLKLCTLKGVCKKIMG